MRVLVTGGVRHITASSERIWRELRWRAGVPFTEGVAEFAAAPAGRRIAKRQPSQTASTHPRAGLSSFCKSYFSLSAARP